MLRGFWRGAALVFLRRTTLAAAISRTRPRGVLHVDVALVAGEGRERVEVVGGWSGRPVRGSTTRRGCAWPCRRRGRADRAVLDVRGEVRAKKECRVKVMSPGIVMSSPAIALRWSAWRSSRT